MKFKITIDIEIGNSSNSYCDGRSCTDRVRDARTHLHQWITKSMSDGDTCPDNAVLGSWMDNIEIVEE